MVKAATTGSATILILEDEELILEEIQESLEFEGYATIGARSIKEAWENIDGVTINLFLVDLNLPDGSGINFTKLLRKDSDVGIIIVTGKVDEIDRVVGLEVGADDYISKPFSSRELVSRVRAVLRRTKQWSYPQADEAISESHEVFEFGEFTLDASSRFVSGLAGEEIPLTTAEFDLLLTFLQQPNRALSRDFLLDQIHGNDWYGYDRGVDGLVSRIRRKFSSGDGAPLIKTVRNIGYLFSPVVRKRPVS